MAPRAIEEAVAKDTEGMSNTLGCELARSLKVGSAEEVGPVIGDGRSTSDLEQSTVTGIGDEWLESFGEPSV